MSDTFLNSFMSDVPRGDSTRFLRQQRPPQARWMKVQDIAKRVSMAYDPRNPGNKLLFGALGDKLIGIDDNRHVMTVAGSRSGKSVALIANLMFYRGSALVTDPKGELAGRTAEKRARLGQKVFVLDPFGVTGKSVRSFHASYNPMQTLDRAEPTFLEDVSLIAEAMVIQSPDQKEPHWDESARHFIAGAIASVSTDPVHANRRHLGTVRELLKQARWVDPESGDALPALYYEMRANGDRLAAEAEALDDDLLADVASAIIGAVEAFYGKTGSELSGVMSTIDRHTQFLDYTAIRRVIKTSDFSLRDLKADPKGVSVYLCFPATRSEISKRWMRIFVNQLLDAMEREETVPAAPVLACLDEFPVLGYMKQLETAAGLMASFHVKLWFILQDWSQGKALYGERWETFASNAGVMQFFGNNDLTTTEYLQRRLGKTLVEVMRAGEVDQERQNKGLTGRSESTELHDLMTADEIMRYFSRYDPLKRQLVLWAGHHPIILQRAEYHDKQGPLAHYV